MKHKTIKIGMILIAGYVFYGIVANNVSSGLYYTIPINSAIFLGFFGLITKYV